jgi:O-succinylbenzoate synthase
VQLSRTLTTPVCLDETLRDARAARQIVDLEGPTVWNLKVHRVGGLTETCRVYRIAREAGIALWAGTMPESGLGSQAAIAAAGLPGFVYPSDVEPSARWFGPGADIVELTMSGDGWMAVPHRSISELLNLERFRAVSRLLLRTGTGAD